MLLHSILNKKKAINWITPLILVTSLSNCSTPVQPDVRSSQSSSIEVDTLSSLMRLAIIAEQQADTRDASLIDISQRLLNIGELSQAKKLISSINSKALVDTDFINYSLTASNIFLADKALFKTQSLLYNVRLERLVDTFSIPRLQQFHKNKAIFYQNIGRTLASLNQYIALGTLLTSNDDILKNNDTIWQQLALLSYNELNTLITDATDPILQGWLTLAAISKYPSSSVKQQNTSTLQWINIHPEHPASQQLPSELALLQKFVDTQPKNIALLLPLQGKLAKAGQAIRDGFLAAYFNNQTSNVTTNTNTPAAVFYDTSSADIHTLYDQAVLNGADIIIGPLSKANVQKLQDKPFLNVPVLALNSLTTNSLISNTETNNSSASFYQFSLSLEDEAVQVADRAWLEGHRQALILSSNAKWSQRAAAAFTQRWQTYGGTVIQNGSLQQGNYSKTIEQTLEIDKSKQRASQLKHLFGRGFEFEPRRRTDIDMIFLVSRATEGRQIKPTLNFHYASNVPVYATSQIYSSANGSDKNIDLNDIRLTTSPWVLEGTQEKALIANNMATNSAYEQLYALGADSFLLYPRLNQLYQFSNQQLEGATGKLSIDENKRVLRTQPWAKVHRGRLKPLPTLTLSSDSAL